MYAFGLIRQCEAIVMLNEVKHLNAYPWDYLEMFRSAQHDSVPMS